MINKKVIKFTILIIFTTLVILFAGKLYQNSHKYDAIQQMPDVELQTLNGEFFRTAIIRDTLSLIIFFSTDCELCINEVEEILKNKDKISYLNLYFVTTADRETLIRFLDLYPIDSLSNASVLIDYKRDFVINFKPKIFPTCYIYGKNRALMDVITGGFKVNQLEQIISKGK